MRNLLIVLLALAGAPMSGRADARTEAFAFPVEGRTAVVYADRLDIVPLDADAQEFTVEAEAKPARRQDGSVEMKAEKPFCLFLPERVVNIAPLAHVTVSSKGDPSRGFRPTPGQNMPESLVDERVNATKNFEFAARETPPTEDDPEWIVLSWKQDVPIGGLFIMTGQWESFPHHDSVRVETYVGTGDPRIDGAPASWQEQAGAWSPMPKNDNANFRCWRHWTADAPFSSAALRLRFVGGGWALRGQQHEIPVPGLGEIAVLSPWTEPEPPQRTDGADGTDGIRIAFDMPFDGAATIQIRDGAGRVVANPVADLPFAAGACEATWDLTDIDGHPVLEPGAYSWRGVAIPPLTLDYRYTYYPLGIPSDRRPWQTVDETGGWLADHDPPRGVVRDGSNMWLNAWAEHGDSVILTDIDMRKLWGETRFWVAVPQEICIDNGFCYGYSQAGWNGTDEEIIRIDPARGYQSRKVFLKKNPPPEKDQKAIDFFDVTVSGFQVRGDTAFVSLGRENRICIYDISKGNAAPHRHFSWATVHTQFDEWKPVLVKEIELPTPGRLRPYGDGLLLTTSGRDVLTLDVKTFETQTLFTTDIENILGLGVGDDGLVWIGAGEPLHQVFAYTPDGRRVKTLGKPGKRRIGAWDNDDLEEPAGVEVDARGRVWVAEHTHWEKRVSIWDPKTARCVQQVLGPTQYGGDGCIDPADSTRLFYRGLELRRDPSTGDVTPVNLVYRPDAPEFPPFAPADYPSYCFRSRGELWFTSFQPPHCHPHCVLWKYEKDRVRPVAAVGAVKDFRSAFRETGNITNAIPSIQAEPGMLFTWTDLDDDGGISEDEVKTRVLEYDGKPIESVTASWNWRMNAAFEVAGVTDLYKIGRLIAFKPASFTDRGYPVYEIPEETKPGVIEAQALMPDSNGNIIALGRPLVSLTPDGVERWRYLNQWPGLHAGHRTTAAGNEPGVLIAPTRIWGMVPTDGDAGEVVAFNSNLGCSYLMTADDGLYLGRIFRDQRVAATVWNYNDIPDSRTLAETSLYDEHFGGTFQRIQGADGRHHYTYVVGKGHCAVVELAGLDGIRRLAGGTFAVTADQIAAAVARTEKAAAKRHEPKVYTVKRGAPVEQDAAIDGFRLGYDETALYVYATVRDDAAPFANDGKNPFELFKSGDTLEVMLRTGKDAGLKRGVQPGDIRLVFAPFEGKTVCVLYDYLVPGTPEEAKVGFSSPWRTATVDRVRILDDVTAEVARSGNRVTLKATVPLAAIHFAPSGEAKGDVGRVLSDASGTRAAARHYWSNKNTAIMSDLPTEVMIDPDLWGTFRFEH
ncbi:MAG: hypothetical protein ACOX5G_12835 [Kiritimatiellia bacterium]